MTVVGVIGGREDHKPVEQRRDTVDDPCHVAVPQFQVATPRLIPVLVEVKQDVQSPVHTEPTVSVEVCVNFQKAAAHDLMQTATDEVRIRQQTGYRGQILKKIDEGRRVELLQNVTQRRRHKGLVRQRKLDLLTGVETLPVGVPRLGEGVDDIP